MSTKNAYRLINPYIEGSLDTVVRASNSFSGGKKIYKNISSLFKNQVDNFYMTIQNVETKDLAHFFVEEKMDKDGSIGYDITKFDDRMNPEIEKKLINSVEKLSKQTGGKHHSHHQLDDSSDSSSSSDETEYFKFRAQPISRFTYFYLPYYRLNMVGMSPIDTARFFVPIFSFPVNPSIEIRFDLYRFP